MIFGSQLRVVLLWSLDNMIISTDLIGTVVLPWSLTRTQLILDLIGTKSRPYLGLVHEGYK